MSKSKWAPYINLTIQSRLTAPGGEIEFERKAYVAMWPTGSYEGPYDSGAHKTFTNLTVEQFVGWLRVQEMFANVSN